MQLSMKYPQAIIYLVLMDMPTIINFVNKGLNDKMLHLR